MKAPLPATKRLASVRQPRRMSVVCASVASSSRLTSIHRSGRRTASHSSGPSIPDLIDELAGGGLVSTLTSRSLSLHLSSARCTGCSARPFSTSSHARNSTSNSSSSSSTPDLIDELTSRGLVSTVTSRSLSSHLSSGSRTVYSGVDPSADSLHVGNLLPLLTLAHFARFNHRPIVLVGGATGSIGDPSGRSTERNALSPSTLQHNISSISSQLLKFFSNVAEYYHTPVTQFGVQMMNNHDWISSISLLDFLGGVGRHARLTQMLARESVASRLSGAGISYTEFSYQLLQALDFAHLHSKHNCTVQIGGSDQLGNITAGIDLIRRTTTLSTPAYGLTLPLLTTSGGEKFGKSAGNAVWLDAVKTGDWEFYQFFCRAEDRDVGKYLRCLTLLRKERVEEVMQEHEKERGKRRAQKELAAHMTMLVRGNKAVEKCRLLSEVLFSHTSVNGDARQVAKQALSKLDTTSITREDGIVAELPKDQVVGADLTRLVVAAGLVKSRAEAKRLLASGGLYVDNAQVREGVTVEEGDLVQGKVLVRAGKGSVKVVVVV